MGTEPLRLHQVGQHADDLDRATAFYRDTLGLRMLARFDPPGLVFFELGSTRLLLERNAPPALLYLDVGDIEARVVSLRSAGVEIVAEAQMIHRDDDGTFGPSASRSGWRSSATRSRTCWAWSSGARLVEMLRSDRGTSREFPTFHGQNGERTGRASAVPM